MALILIGLLPLIILIIIVIKYTRTATQFKNFNKKYILITGCDTGIGKALALRLRREKIPVFACCLIQESADSLLEESKEIHSTSEFYTPLFDVASEEQALEIAHYVGKATEGLGLWSVVCNAGLLGCPVPDDWLSINDYQKTLNVNLLGTIRTCHTLKQFLRPNKGRILIVSSCLGQASMPYTSTYNVSKFAVEGYADTLRMELRGQGISVHTMVPGFYSTQLTSLSRLEELISDAWSRSPPDVKRRYGHVFLTNYVGAFLKGTKAQCSENLEEVMKSYLHAITAKYPKRKYRIGWRSMGFFLLRRSPTWFQDWFNMAFWRFYIGIPDVIEEKSEKDS